MFETAADLVDDQKNICNELDTAFTRPFPQPIAYRKRYDALLVPKVGHSRSSQPDEGITHISSGFIAVIGMPQFSRQQH